MLLKDDKKRKGAIVMITSKIKAGKHDMTPDLEKMQGKSTNDMGDEKDNSVGIDAAVNDIMGAVERKDKSALKMALKSFISLAKDESESEEEEEC